MVRAKSVGGAHQPLPLAKKLNPTVKEQWYWEKDKKGTRAWKETLSEEQHKEGT